MNGEPAQALGKGNGYSFKSVYGGIKGTVQTADGLIIEYGLVNSGNWHNMRIHLSIETDGDTVTVKQTISYMRDERGIAAAVNESTAAADEKRISVYREGIF